MREQTYLRIKRNMEGKELLPHSTAIWLGGFQESKRYLLWNDFIEEVWVEGALFYKFIK